jgi:hypothetical protein
MSRTNLIVDEESFCFLCRLSVREIANQQTPCKAFPNTFLIGLAGQYSEHEVHDIDTKPLLLHS